MPWVKAASIIINRKRHELEQVKKMSKTEKDFRTMSSYLFRSNRTVAVVD